MWKYPNSVDVLEAAGLQTIANTIAKRLSNIARTIEGRQVLKECREAKRRRGSPPRIMWWDQDLDFIEEGSGGGGLGFTMNRGGSQRQRRRRTNRDGSGNDGPSQPPAVTKRRSWGWR